MVDSCMNVMGECEFIFFAQYKYLDALAPWRLAWYILGRSARPDRIENLPRRVAQELHPP